MIEFVALLREDVCRSTDLKMNENASRFYTALFAALTTIGLLAGGAYTIIQYFGARTTDRRTYDFQATVAQLEAKKPFYSKHLDLCSEASAATATIATTKDQKEKLKATENFWRLYWGPLGMVEEQDVENAMVNFGDCLHGHCGGQPLTMLSLDVSHSCRKEISAHFQLELPKLTRKLEESDEH